MTKTMGSHESTKAESVDWLTPPEIIKELGPFDLDPCMSKGHPWNTAINHYYENGLNVYWDTHQSIWLNPPYGMAVWVWLNKLATHGNGLALIFARTETKGFHEQVWSKAHGLLFFKGRLSFYYPDGTKAKNSAGAPSVLVAYGEQMSKRLKSCDIDGKYIKLI